MHSILNLLFLSPLAAAAVSTCNADSCLRSIRASNIPGRIATGSVDCSSFLRATYTPSAYTSTTVLVVPADTVVTITSTITSTISQPTTVTSIYGELSARDASPTEAPVKVRENLQPQVTGFAVVKKRQTTPIPNGIPSYASLCSGTVRYSSACSCIGVAATTVTIATPTVVTTSVSTSTETTITTTTTTTNIGAQSTVTVCQPPTYGVAYNKLILGRNPDQSGVKVNWVTRNDIRSLGDCCAACFKTPGCATYIFDEDVCSQQVTYDGTSPLATAQCPNAVMFALANTEPEKAVFGLGACAYWRGKNNLY